jgi:peptidoglycan/xylan/chitin deacetylase (PgdA/CDA1 family)
MTRRYVVALISGVLALLAGSLVLAGCSDAVSAAAAWHSPGGEQVDAPAKAGTGGQGGGAAMGPAGSAKAPVTMGLQASPQAAPPAGPNMVVRTTGSNDVALTFDDGPGPNTPQILALLREQGIKATFCVIGVNVQANPGLVQAIVREGHTLCNHSWNHDAALGTRSVETIRSDMQRTNDAIHRAVPGVPIKYFRHPAGNFTPNSIAVAKELGMASLGWNVDPKDWDTKSYPVGPTLTDHVVSAVQAMVAPGAIVLSHDGGGDRSSTVAAYRTLLPSLRDRFHLVALPT